MPSSTPPQLANIIPAVKLPRDLEQVFTYAVPVQLQQAIVRGSIVQIPFRRKLTDGVVLAVRAATEKPPFRLKFIKNVWSETRFSAREMELMQYIATHYYSPLSWTVKTMLPQRSLRSARRTPKFLPDFETQAVENPQWENLVKKIAATPGTILIHHPPSHRLNLYRALIDKHTVNTPSVQALILFAETFDLDAAAQFFLNRYGAEAVAVLNGNLTANQFFAEWKKAVAGSAKIVLGTRRALFTPFKKLGLIVVDEAHSSGFKQWDQSPRYEATLVAQKLAEIWQAPIVFASPTPSAEIFHLSQKNSSQPFSKIILGNPHSGPPQIIDMNTERQNDNPGVLSEALKKELLTTVYHHRQALIFTPRIGNYTALICKDCQWIAACDICQNTLIERRSTLFCSRCRKTFPILTECPKCHGSNLHAFGSGIERTAAAVEELFQGKNIRVAMLGGGTEEISAAQAQKICRDFTLGKINVLIGTQMALKSWPQPNLTLVGVLFPESLFIQNYFRSQEKLRQLMQKFYAAPAHQKVIIQTHKPDHPFFANLHATPYTTFLTEEIRHRRQVALKIPYPPFGRIIKMIYKHPDPAAAEKEARYAYQILKNFLLAHQLGKQVEIIAPFAARNYHRHGKYRWHLLLRHTTDLPLATRDQILSQIKKDWIFDIDPDEIL